MRNYQLLLFFGLFWSVVSCSQKSEEEAIVLHISEGLWRLEFTEDSIAIPVRAVFQKGGFTFTNSSEKIITSTERITEDSIKVLMPVFGTYLLAKIHPNDSLSGHWINPFKEPVYSMGFTAKLHDKSIHSPPFIPKDSSVYSVRFSPNSKDEYPAVGVFKSNQDVVEGTFLTETGDYRFLEGEKTENGFWLSCFDGSHLFFFDIEKGKNDSLTGVFYSGKHWSEPLIASYNPQAHLLDPDSITTLTSSPGDWHFTIYNSNLTEANFSSNSLAGKVSVVQLFGSWCPNCMDESLYFKELHAKYSNLGLQIIPVAFERGDDSTKWNAAVQKYSSSLGLNYPYYLGGGASKGRAAEIFNMLSEVSSFPTTIFIDKKGRIRKIHTGFYGPGTGHYYQEFTESTDQLVQALLSE